MELKLNNKKALVCGSSQGIGKAIAIELALLGASIILIARDIEALQNTLEELPTPINQKHEYLIADFANPTQLMEVVSNYTLQNTIEILINNSGGPSSGAITNETIEKFSAVFSQHLLCNQLLAQAVLPGMKAAQYGRIINIISTSVKQPLRNLGVSNTIRGAVASWAKTWSYEVAQFGITVNNVLPGATATNRLKNLIINKSNQTNEAIDSIEQEMINEIPAKRFAQPQEIAALAAFLATPAAAYINGTSIPVDGGRTGAI
jgi:3-oxoacyl-[acyl-carrier protein] reductase